MQGVAILILVAFKTQTKYSDIHNRDKNYIHT